MTAMAALHRTMSLLSHFFLHCSLPERMLIFSLLFFTLSLISLSFLLFSLYSKKCSCRNQTHQRIIATCYAFSPKASLDAKVDEEPVEGSDDPTLMTRSLLLKVIPPDTPGWEPVFDKNGGDEMGPGLKQDRVGTEEEEEEEGEEKKKRKTKKRAKKKKQSAPNGGWEMEKEKEKKEELLVLLYPFTTSSSGIQRKIKEQLDQLLKSHESNCLTMAEVGEFANFLLEAKKELQHRSEVIQRKFRITKALLKKAERSSFDRLRQQIYRVELEQKRLEEDAFVYNRVQQQLKLSPAYRKILKKCACPEMHNKTAKEVEGSDNDFADISFEELLAQEKKDAFWQRQRKARG